jgi:hypothetical protein
MDSAASLVVIVASELLTGHSLASGKRLAG